jgi:hypothetical protein
MISRIFTRLAYYIAGTLIAWDYNPANWWALGRIIIIALILVAMFEDENTKETK